MKEIRPTVMQLSDNQIWHHIAKDILKELQYLPYALVIGALAVGILWYRNTNKSYSGKRLFREAVVCLLCIYTTMVLNITLIGRESGSREGISLTLFETLGGVQANAYVVENILLFIPLGMLGAVQWKPMRNLCISIVIGIGGSLLIETVQLLTGRGYFQIDDIVTNAMGICIGCLLYHILYKVIFRKKIRDRR